MISAARRGSALPFVRFITSPTNEPIARVRPPRYAATCSGIDATTAAHLADLQIVVEEILSGIVFLRDSGESGPDLSSLFGG